MLASNVSELINFVENVDKCDHRDSANPDKMGHPKECYIHYGNNYACSSVLLFLRSMAPHYPFMRNIVSKVYKVKRELRKIREIDTAVENVDIIALTEISETVKEKSLETFVQLQIGRIHTKLL